jgi:heat-inducible transcriptional repressor
VGREPHEEPELNERLRDILQAVVEDYIATAEPVGSRSLTKRNLKIDLSPATVRNAMADLEDLGFLSAPHASAGRVPTALAFRVYVERLASRGRISPREQEIINAVALPADSKARELSQVLQDAGRALSSLANHAALVLLPRLDEVVFSEIEFVPVRERTVLVVFVAKSGLIQHRLVDVDFPLDRDELRRMASYLGSLLGGKTLFEVRQTIIEAMRDERAQADAVMRHALMLGERSLPVEPKAQDSVLVEGERALFDQPEFADISKMRNLLRAFEEKTVLLRLLDAASQRKLDAPAAARADTTIAFGAEGSVRELKELAVVVSSYTSDQGPAGQVGIVGPIRMDYSRVIPLVEYTAGALSRSLGVEPDPTGGSGDKKR